MRYSKGTLAGLYISILFFLFSCKKDELAIMSLSNISIVNAMTDGKAIRFNDYLRDSALNFNAKIFSIKSGNWPLYLFPSGDSLNPYFKGAFDLEPGGIYSMYLSGPAAKPDTMWVKENVAAYYTDSTIGVRVANLSAGSEPLSLTLASDPNKELFSGVPYKGVTAYVRLPVGGGVPTASIVFQLRKPDKTLLATYTLPPIKANSSYVDISVLRSRNKNITLVAKGIQNTAAGPNAIGLFPVKNY
jgi:hypothetical protein